MANRRGLVVSVGLIVFRLMLTLVTSSLFAQDVVPTRRQRYPGSFTPTNEPSGSGVSIISWYLLSDYYTNGGTTATLPDRGGVHNYDLTNTRLPFGPTNYGGALRFWGGDSGIAGSLTNTTYSSTQPHEVVMVFASMTASNLGNTVAFFDGHTVNLRNAFRQEVANQWSWFAGTIQFALWPITNKVTCIDTIYNTTVSQFYTNGVLAATLNVGAQNETTGFHLGSSLTGINQPNMVFYGMVTYSATNSPTARSNLYYYFKSIRQYPLP